MTIADKTDQELLAECQAGRLDAFEALYGRHARGVLAYLLGALADRSRAEDILQEIFIGLVRQIRSLRPDTNVRAYLYSSARNRLHNVARDQGRKQAFLEKFSVLTELRSGEAAGPEHALTQKETVVQLNAALAGLGDDEREAILLHTQGDMTFHEIAEITGSPLGSVTSRYQRALEKIREEMGE